MSDSMIERVAEALEVEAKKHGMSLTAPLMDIWPTVLLARAAISALRKPDMTAIMRVSGQTGMRPTDVDLAVTGYLDAILKEWKAR